VAPNVIPMDWWKVYRHQLPCIAQLSRKWLCVTATSTPSERVFSDCRLALTAKHSRLKDNVQGFHMMFFRNAHCLTITDADVLEQ